MGVGNAQHFEDALNDSILAIAPVEGVEGDVRAQGRERLADLAIDIKARDLESFGFERPGAGFARAQRDFALVGKPAHQHGDVFGHVRGPFVLAGGSWRRRKRFRQSGRALWALLPAGGAG